MCKLHNSRKSKTIYLVRKKIWLLKNRTVTKKAFALFGENPGCYLDFSSSRLLGEENSLSYISIGEFATNLPRIFIIALVFIRLTKSYNITFLVTVVYRPKT